MLQKEIDEMSHDELYMVVEDHKGDEVLSAISLRLMQENRKMRAALKVYQDRDKQLEDVLMPDKGVMFLPKCSDRENVGTVGMCRNKESNLFNKPCSKRCETPTKGGECAACRLPNNECDCNNSFN